MTVDTYRLNDVYRERRELTEHYFKYKNTIFLNPLSVRNSPVSRL